MTALERFLGYVKIHTASSEDSESTPTAQREFDLSRELEKEMKDSSWFLQLTMAKKIKKLFDEKINPDDEAVVAKHLKLLDEKFGPILEEGDY